MSTTVQFTDSDNATRGALVIPKTYVALLTQSGTNAPVATVLDNTLGGTVVWTYIGTGVYRATLAGAFPSDKTVISGLQGVESAANVGIAKATRISDNAISVQSLDTLDGQQYNDQLLQTSFIVEVYGA